MVKGRKMDKSEKTILLVIVGIVGGCLCIGFLCMGTFLAWGKIFPAEPTPIYEVVTPETSPNYCSVISQATVVQQNGLSEAAGSALETQKTIAEMIIPITDLNKIAEKFSGKENIPTHLETLPIAYDVGDQLKFYKLNEDNENILTTATLAYETENIYFWAENGLVLDKRDLKALVDTFAYEIYPLNQEFFGPEWNPGVDNDPHLYILYAGDLGSSLAGYNASTDTVLPEAHPFSNAHEMFVINSDFQTLTDPYTLSTMAHEFQHLIHGYQDSNEELWLNEGFSELATFINGYSAGGFDYYFSLTPDMQLNDWSGDSDLNDLNYGASYLYTTYMQNRFGETVTRAVVADDANGFVSVDNVFSRLGVVDPISGSAVTADEFFREWTLANFLNDPDLVDGRYYYANYPEVPTTGITEYFDDCDGYPIDLDVHQFGTDYYQIACNQDFVLTFEGDEMTEVFRDDGENQSNVMWSNRADSSDTMLTREFDFTSTSGPIEMSYDAWYDIETDFDYAYVLASTDGEDWKILDSTSCTTYDPNGNNYGCGLNGQTYEWATETVDLSKYAGQIVSIRFEYVTDGALVEDGLAIDNISIPAINYNENFEGDSGGWLADGFTRIVNHLPQTFLVSMILENEEEPIQKFTLAPGEKLEITLDPDCYFASPILVVSGTTRFSKQIANYTITLTPK
jgi:hypothetical protein